MYSNLARINKTVEICMEIFFRTIVTICHGLFTVDIRVV